MITKRKTKKRVTTTSGPNESTAQMPTRSYDLTMPHQTIAAARQSSKTTKATSSTVSAAHEIVGLKRARSTWLIIPVFGYHHTPPSYFLRKRPCSLGPFPSLSTPAAAGSTVRNRSKRPLLIMKTATAGPLLLAAAIHHIRLPSIRRFRLKMRRTTLCCSSKVAF